MKALIRLTAVLLFVLALLVGIGGYSYFINAYKGVTPSSDATEKVVFIEPGTPTEDMAYQLRDQGVIDHPFVFMAAARLRQWEQRMPLQAGEYLFPPNISISDVITLLQSGKTFQRKVTIPEGLMSVEIVAILNAEEGLTGTIDTIPAEGSLLPETYNYTRNTTRAQIIERMQKSMATTLAQLWDKRADGLPIKTPEEAVILASVVEKETGIAAERPRVAGVFVNRLNINMPLQTDPTVIYAVTQGKYKLDRPLSRKDLATVSPYNTYLNTGLPPGPIANPGRASLEATLHPEAHEYLYFVAYGPGTAENSTGHAFSKTLDEHGRNVLKLRAVEKAAKKPPQ